MKLVFCGTPEFAVPALEGVLAAGYDVPLALTQPDRPSGRGLHLVPPPVKAAALARGVEVVQPEKIKNNADLRARLEAIAPDVIVVVAYGRIIPAWMLALPRLGNINVHGSLLPRYRGAAPIQWAIARGEAVTGITTMLLNEGLDTGDMLMKREFPIDPDQTAADLYPLLAKMGAELLLVTLTGLEAGSLTPEPQPHEAATYAPILTREDGRIDFSQPAREIYNRWRGFYPWPGAWTTLEGKKLSVTRMVRSDAHSSGPPGMTIVDGTTRVFATCGDGRLVELAELQLEGKRSMPAVDFLRGHALKTGTQLGVQLG